MTEANESIDRLTRLEWLMEQQLINNAELSQQIKEVSVQIKAQATFDNPFDRSLSATRQLIDSNAKVIAENTQQISKLVKFQCTNERRTNSIAKSVMAVTSDVKDTVVSVKAIARALERQNRELSDALRQQSRDFFDALERHQDQIDTFINRSDWEAGEGD
jgi:predicted Rossmann fold nucleotide-binding protein DprA/Smf involved in DNA uptake